LLQAAGNHPEWNVVLNPRQAGGAQRDRFIDNVAQKAASVVALEKNGECCQSLGKCLGTDNT
jgi:hypothetical protein